LLPLPRARTPLFLGTLCLVNCASSPFYLLVFSLPRAEYLLSCHLGPDRSCPTPSEFHSKKSPHAFFTSYFLTFVFAFAQQRFPSLSLVLRSIPWRSVPKLNVVFKRRGSGISYRLLSLPPIPTSRGPFFFPLSCSFFPSFSSLPKRFP